MPRSLLVQLVGIKRLCFFCISDPPGPPVRIEPMPYMLSISVSWIKPLDDGGKMVLDYKIVLLDDNKRELKLFTRITANPYTLQNLRQNRNYTIIIYARNDIGYGKPANVTISTLEAGEISN